MNRDAQAMSENPYAEADASETVESRVFVEAVTLWKRASQVEFRIKSSVVQVWSAGQCVGIFERPRLRSWLTHPERWISEGAVVLIVDPRSGGDRIAVDLPTVLMWTLSPQEMALLREAV